MADDFAFDLEAAVEAAERWEQNERQHERFERAVLTDTLHDLDTPERHALRVRRLMCRLRQVAPEVAAETVTEALERAVATPAGTLQELGDIVRERVVGRSADFLFVEFFEQGLFASRAVGRIVTALGGGRRQFGTGFMVSPRLLLTNHHVLPTDAVAGTSVVEFNYQRDWRRQEMTPRSSIPVGGPSVPRRPHPGRVLEAGRLRGHYGTAFGGRFRAHPGGSDRRTEGGLRCGRVPLGAAPHS